jgi:hypothetical protein
MPSCRKWDRAQVVGWRPGQTEAAKKVPGEAAKTGVDAEEGASNPPDWSGTFSTSFATPLIIFGNMFLLCT